MTKTLQKYKQKWKLRKCEAYYSAELNEHGTLIDMEYCITHEQDFLFCRIEAKK